MEWFKPVKAHVTVMRGYLEASNLSRELVTRDIETVFLKPCAAIIHIVGEHGSLYGLLGVDKYSFMELFDNLVKIEEVEPDETLIPGELLFCTEDFSLPPIIRAPRIHRQCVLVVIVASPIIDTPYGSFDTRLVARIFASCNNPRRAINIVAQYAYIKTPLVKYTLREAVEEALGKKDQPIVNTLEALRTLLRPVKPDKIIITPLEVHMDQVEGVIHLGEILDPLLEPTGQEYRLPLSHGHILVVGATGSGKSTTLARLAQESSRHVKTIILDWTGEHIETLGQLPGAEIVEPGETYTIPLRTPWDTVPGVVEKIAYYVETTWGTTLTPLQYRLLVSALTRIDNPTPQTIIITLNGLGNHNRRDIRQSADALISRLIPLQQHNHIYDPATRPPLTIENTKGNPVIINLSGIKTTHTRMLTAQLILYNLLQQIRETRTPTHILVDEAHNYLKQTRETPPPVIKAYLEYRKYNAKITIATSNTTIIPPEITQNTTVLITHRLPSITQTKPIIDILLANPQQKPILTETLRTLPTGTTLTTTPWQQKPAITQIHPPKTP